MVIDLENHSIVSMSPKDAIKFAEIIWGHALTSLDIPQVIKEDVIVISK